MAAATDVFENQLLALIFNNANLGGIGDSTGLRGASAAGQLYISLHTANPGEGGNQSTSEAGYAGYSRVGVARTAAGWEVTDNAVSNVETVQFPAATSGSSTITHVGIGTAATGAGKLLYRLALQNPSSISVTQGVAPKFDPDAITITVD